MIKLLIVAATRAEVEPLLAYFNPAQQSPDSHSFIVGNYSVTLLITGVGIMETTYALTAHLSANKYDNALNMGICGAFNRGIKLGSVVNVVKDRLGDYGAEDGELFVDAIEMGLQKELYPFKEKGLLCSTWHFSTQTAYESVSGITVNTVHGNEASISAIMDKYNSDIESMEGAAFYYVCAMFHLPSAQVRAVSNYVERRNKDNWRIREAIENCCTCVKMILIN